MPIGVVEAEWVFLRERDDQAVGMEKLVQAAEADLEPRDHAAELKVGQFLERASRSGRLGSSYGSCMSGRNAQRALSRIAQSCLPNVLVSLANDEKNLISTGLLKARVALSLGVGGRLVSGQVRYGRRPRKG